MSVLLVPSSTSSLRCATFLVWPETLYRPSVDMSLLSISIRPCWRKNGTLLPSIITNVVRSTPKTGGAREKSIEWNSSQRQRSGAELFTSLNHFSVGPTVYRGARFHALLVSIDTTVCVANGETEKLVDRCKLSYSKKERKGGGKEGRKEKGEREGGRD